MRRPSGSARRPSTGALRRPPTLAPPPAGDPWTIVRAFMQRACGVSLADDQRYLLDARLGPVAKANGFPTIADLVKAACASSPETRVHQAVVDALTTHETYFFRDQGFWRTFVDVLVPRLVAARSGRPIRIWSAACSTGQEPYTIAMLFAESHPGVPYEITATDVSELAIERARAGTYSVLEVNRGVGAQRLVRHFEQSLGGFRVKASLGRSIIWSPHNLLGAKPDPVDCDVVLCRNVLIYFNELDRSSVVQRLARAAATSGFVGVGCTEFLGGPPFAPGWYPASGLRTPELARRP